MATTRRRMSELEMRLLKWLLVPFSRWNARTYLGSLGLRMGRLLGRDVCVVSMIGARSGQRRDVPIMYVPHGAGVLLVASLGGAPKHPSWYHNLRKNPDVTVHVKDRTLRLRARLTTAAEKAKLWPICVEHYPPYATYQERTDRDIPVFICEPRSS
jgi:deazaflavin-dependent oxidoreductase (nitroreductase family)